MNTDKKIADLLKEFINSPEFKLMRGSTENTEKESEQDKKMGRTKAEDKYDRDILEDISDFYHVDFEELRKMDISDANLLFDRYAMEKGRPNILSPTFKDQQIKDDIERGVEKSGGWLSYLKKIKEKENP